MAAVCSALSAKPWPLLSPKAFKGAIWQPLKSLKRLKTCPRGFWGTQAMAAMCSASSAKPCPAQPTAWLKMCPKGFRGTRAVAAVAVCFRGIWQL